MINIKSLAQSLPIKDVTKYQLFLKTISVTQIPLIFLTFPKVLEIDSQRSRILIKLNKFTKNHLGSMYFGALSIGADLCVGLLAMFLIFERDLKINLVFKSFEAEFLKRPDGDVVFECIQGTEIKKMVDRALDGERVTEKIAARAICKGECVAEFKLVLSLKKN